MKKIIGTTKYLLFDELKSAGAYYLIILAISVLMVWTALSFDTNGSMSGMEISTVIFMFVIGLNSFKANFRFLQSNCISRRRFFFSILLSFPAFALAVSAVDTALYRLLGLLLPYRSMLHQLFNRSDIGASFVWQAAAYLLALCLGFFITMLYYRSNTFLKLLISVSPVIFIILFVYAVRNWGDVLLPAIEDLFLFLTGFGTPFAIFRTALSFFGSSVVLTGLSFLLIRRMPLKNT